MAEYAESGVRLVALPDRSGKTEALMSAIESTTADVLVFSDANTSFAPDAVARLVAALADESVGCVTGELRYRRPEQGNLSGEGLYWWYETWLKRLESMVGSVVGATGAIHAVRREDFPALVPAAISDLEVGLHVVAEGSRVVYQPAAVGYEDLPKGPGAGFRRKYRIVPRSLGSLHRYRALLWPFRSGFFALQLLSHKVLRWFGGLAIVGVLVGALLAGPSPVYRWLLVAQLVFYGLVAAGLLLRAIGLPSRWLRGPIYLCSAQAASLVALVLFAMGREATVWESRGGYASCEPSRTCVVRRTDLGEPPTEREA